MNKPLGKLFDIMPKELLKNKLDISPGSDNTQIKNYLDNEQITEKAQVDKSEIIRLKRSLRRPKRHVFIKEKENNGMVVKFTELSVWRENLLIKHKNEPNVENAIELILHELQTRLKNSKDINNQNIAIHMAKHYKKLTAFSGHPIQIGKYTVQIMSKIIKALGPEKLVAPGETDQPFISTYRPSKRISVNYTLNPIFFEHSAATLGKIVALRYRLHMENAAALRIAEKSNVKAAAKTQAPKIETVPDEIKPENIEAPVVVDIEPKQVESISPGPALVPENTNGSLVVNYVLSKLDINDLINKVVDRGGALRINADSFEINMAGGK